MKKKLLLSSVAALTLVAAYNTVNAAAATPFGTAAAGTATAKETFGVESTAVENLLKAFEIKAPTTVAEVEETAASVAERQTAAENVRAKNEELTKAKDLEAKAEAEFKKAQEDFFTASKNYKLAQDNAVAAAKKSSALSETKDLISAEKTKSETELNTKKGELGTKGATPTGAYLAQKNANDAFETAKKDVEAQYRKKPVSSNDVAAHEQYQAAKLAKEAALKVAEKAKKEADEKVAKLEKEVSKLEAAVKSAEKELKVLTDAIEALDKVAGDATTQDGVVNGVTLKQLDDLTEEKANVVSEKQYEYVNSSVFREGAQQNFDNAVKEAKEVYKRLKVEFKLEDVLAVDTPTPEAVVTFGWNKDDKGNWNYLLDSKGTKAMERWVNDNGTWYYLNKEGVMQKWWVNVNGTWYYLNGSGEMQTGWLQDNGTWYYLNGSGAMVTGWFEVNGKWYYADASGALLVNTTTPDGYTVNENGEWV